MDQTEMKFSSNTYYSSETDIHSSKAPQTQIDHGSANVDKARSLLARSRDERDTHYLVVRNFRYYSQYTVIQLSNVSLF